MSEFHFAAARITAAQICRAAGLERTVPSVLDAITDILVQYLSMLGTAVQSAAESRGSSISDANDAMLGLVECRAVRGGLSSTGLQTQRYTPATGIEDIIELSCWLRGPEHARQVAVARPQRPVVGSLGAVQGAALAALPSSAAAASQFTPNNSAGEQQAQQAQQVQAQQIQESQPQAQPQLQAQPQPPVPNSDLSSMPLIDQQDWLLMAMNRQALMGHRDLFVNTELGPHTEPDPTIYGKSS